MTEVVGTGQGVKTLGIKLPDAQHAQLVLIAGLEDMSLTDAIKAAVDMYIEHKKGQGGLAARAAEVAAEIEREAALRRSALQSLFGPAAGQPEAPAETPKAAGRKSTRE